MPLRMFFMTWKLNQFTKSVSLCQQQQQKSLHAKLLSCLIFIDWTEETDTGSQFKLRTIFENDVIAMFKPKRTSREQQAQPNQIHLAEYERHTSEIAAFHLDRFVYLYFYLYLLVIVFYFLFFIFHFLDNFSLNIELWKGFWNFIVRCQQLAEMSIWLLNSWE